MHCLSQILRTPLASPPPPVSSHLVHVLLPHVGDEGHVGEDPVLQLWQRACVRVLAPRARVGVCARAAPLRQTLDERLGVLAQRAALSRASLSLAAHTRGVWTVGVAINSAPEAPPIDASSTTAEFAASLALKVPALAVLAALVVPAVASGWDTAIGGLRGVGALE
eukprot:1164967-Pleurochrysis_carterae.AAC.2